MTKGLFAYLRYDHPAVKKWLQFRASRMGCDLVCGPYAWDLSKNGQVVRISNDQYAGVAQLAEDFDELFEVLIPGKAGRKTLLDFSRVHLHTYRDSGLQFELAQWPERDLPLEVYFDTFQPLAGDLIFDLGADSGISTYGLSQIDVKVVAFEADPRLRVILERNVARHGLKNVTVAKDTATSLADLIRLHGVPSFCKINLDRLPIQFFLKDQSDWTPHSIYFAAHSFHGKAQRRFASLMKKAGCETERDKATGIVWARPG